MKKTCAILLRGHTKRQSDKRVNDIIDFDCSLGSIESFLVNVLSPLEEFFSVDVYTAASDCLSKDYLISKIPNLKYFQSIWRTQDAQKRNMMFGLNQILDCGNVYEKIFITRFDLLYKQKITNLVTKSNCDVLYGWQEIPISPIERSCDTIHWINNSIDNSVFEKFVNAVSNDGGDEGGMGASFHILKHSTDRFNLHSCYMIDGIYDSNTTRSLDSESAKKWGANISKNPIYALSGRAYFHNDIDHPTLFRPRKG